MVHTTPSPDFYSLLQVSRSAPPNDIKMAYHRALLRLHPDKQPRLRSRGSIASDIPTDPTPEEASVDMALLKEAYETLSDVDARAAYNGLLRREENERARSCGPRPAQVVSLEEFTAIETAPGTGPDLAQEWRYGCRCGGIYCITQHDLEKGMHLVGCDSCSEVIWVGYEETAISGDEEGEGG